MAPRYSRPCRFPRQNPPPLDPMKDELAREPGPVRGPHSGGTSPAPSCNPTQGPELVLALNPAPVLAPALPSCNELFKKFMKAYLESNQGPRQPPEEANKPLRLRYQRYTILSCTWTAINFVSSAKIILRLLGPPGLIGLPLQLSFSVETLVCAGQSSNVATEVKN